MRYMGWFLLIIASICFVAGCSSPVEEPDSIQYLIGVSQANLTEPWRIQMNREIREEASGYSRMKVIFTNAGQRTDTQIQDVERLMKQGIDLLIISPNEVNRLTPIVNEVYRSVPVIVLDRDDPGFNYTLYIGPDNYRIGRQAGQLIVDLLGGRPGNIVEIQGPSDSPPAIGRSKGFREVIADHPNLTLIDSIVADWLRDKAEDRLKLKFPVYPKINVIFAQNDAMALGAYRAASKLRIPDILYVGIDGLPGPEGGVQLVKDGILTGTFTYPTGGKEAIQYAMKILGKEDNLPRRMILESKSILGESFK